MSFFKRYKTAILSITSVAAVYAVMMLLGVTCPIKFLTGVSCPGCGMTRAFLSAIRFNFADAFHYHPLWICVIPAFGTLFYLKKYKKARAFNIALTIMCATMISVYLYRMINGESDVVVFELENSIVYRIFSALIKRF